MCVSVQLHQRDRSSPTSSSVYRERVRERASIIMRLLCQAPHSSRSPRSKYGPGRCVTLPLLVALALWNRCHRARPLGAIWGKEFSPSVGKADLPRCENGEQWRHGGGCIASASAGMIIAIFHHFTVRGMCVYVPGYCAHEVHPRVKCSGKESWLFWFFFVVCFVSYCSIRNCSPKWMDSRPSVQCCNRAGAYFFYPVQPVHHGAHGCTSGKNLSDSHVERMELIPFFDVVVSLCLLWLAQFTAKREERNSWIIVSQWKCIVVFVAHDNSCLLALRS